MGEEVTTGTCNIMGFQYTLGVPSSESRISVDPKLVGRGYAFLRTRNFSIGGGHAFQIQLKVRDTMFKISTTEWVGGYTEILVGGGY